jgi:hypothetical protein
MGTVLSEIANHKNQRRLVQTYPISLSFILQHLIDRESITRIIPNCASGHRSLLPIYQALHLEDVITCPGAIGEKIKRAT